MENGTKQPTLVSISVLIGALIIGGSIMLRGEAPSSVGNSQQTKEGQSGAPTPSLPETVALPVRWEDIPKELVAAGVLDTRVFESVYRARADRDAALAVLSAGPEENITITRENAGAVLNMFWALGLGQKSGILTQGPMSDTRYGGAGRFASTAGWILSRGDAMEHFSRHPFLPLTPPDEALVRRIADGIYRPCCDNPASFPDCNHGMAMLGLLLLLVSQGISEDEIWKIALAVNRLWFPDQYETIARYLESRGESMRTADPRKILGREYSSASGYNRIVRAVTTPLNEESGGGCSV
jgi:hypothetical protein